MVTHRAFKVALYSELARIGQALAHPLRIELLDLLAQAERSVEDLAAELALPVANVSQHLQALRRARIVISRRAGTRVFYRLAGDDIARLLLALREVGENHLAEVDAVLTQYVGQREHSPFPTDTLPEAVRAGQIVLLDVRPANEFAAGHLPGARSLPLAHLASHLAELPRDRPIVVYCRGRFCTFADEAVALLRQHGFTAWRIDDSPADWRARGWPVEVAVMESPRP